MAVCDCLWLAFCAMFSKPWAIFSTVCRPSSNKKTQESVKIESKDTDTEQPSAARSFVFPSKKKRVSAEKDPFFLVGARCARAFFFLRKFTFQKHQTVSQKIDCHFLRGVHFSKKIRKTLFLETETFEDKAFYKQGVIGGEIRQRAPSRVGAAGRVFL